MLTWNVPLVTATALIVTYVVRKIRRRSLGPLPPGPKGWPIIGNISDIPHKNSWVTYVEWKKKYGDIVYVEPFGSPTVILNNLDDIHELLDRRSAITADRPRMVMANELMGWGWDFVHMPHDNYWRQHRRVFHQYFQQKNMPIHFPVIRKAGLTLLNNLLESPDNFRSHIRQYAGSILLKLTYDHDVVSKDDYYVALANRALKLLLQVVHVGSNVVDVVPVLKYIPAWFPGAGFKREARISAQYSKELRDIPFEQAKMKVSSGSIGHCFVSECLTNDEMGEDIIKNAAGIAYLAGSDTTSAVLETFMLAMLHYPEVQVRAREEIDSVTDGTRLPEFNDRPSMPYIEAMISEVFRWAPAAPLAVPHRSQEPDVYKGYYFPAGTIFVPNVIGIFQDETIFPEPKKFMPERFFHKNVEFDPQNTGFGFGRRVCPGRYVAHNSFWLAIVHILAAFTISPKQNENGRERLTPPEFADGLVLHPAAFEVDITPRSKKALEMIQQANLAKS